LIRDLAAGASPALAAARRASELQLVREQLVAAREQERRRIARDLHDGIGPVLSGLGFTLDALRSTVHGTPEAEAVATQARDQVRQAGQLVRRVANELRPAGVDQLGLLGALREIAAWHNSPSLSVALTANDLGELSAATEVSAYLIVAEAITNVARHAHATDCQVTLNRTADTLTVTVEDNGIGIAGSSAGLGRTSMIERAEELGGQILIASPESGGTTVRASLPAGEPVPELVSGHTAGRFTT
jgi:signal transduction histidine kinase